jgi:hypothetical protein
MNATKAVYKFNRKQDELLFYARVNPITTLFYSMLWFIPIMMAILDCIGRKQIEWEHTPREGEPEILDASAFMQKEFALS